VLGFNDDDWVEITDDDSELNGFSRPLLQIDTVKPATREVTFKQSIPTLTNPSNLQLRRWDQSGSSATTNGVAVTGVFQDLESGVQVLLSEGSYRTGDFWIIPARTSTGELDWPPFQVPNTNPIAQPPLGIGHHYCRLAILTVSSGKLSLGVDSDCRPTFPPLTKVCKCDTGIRVLEIQSLDPNFQLHTLLNDSNLNDSNVEIPFFKGIDATCDTSIAPISITRPTCFVTVEQPIFLPTTPVSSTAAAYSRVALAGTVSAAGAVISWRASQAALQLVNSLTIPPDDRGILARFTLKGNFILSATDPNFFLDGDLFGIRQQDTNTISVRLPSGDHRKGGDLEIWFWLVPVIAPPTMIISFNPASIPVFGTTTITFTITNPNASELTSVGFSDSLPAGLIVATPNGVTNLCHGTITATPGTSIISLSGVTLEPGSSCTVTVNVSATTPGQKTNTVTVTSDQGSGSLATATLIVNPPFVPPTMTKSFNLASIAVGGTATITFTITNPNTSELTSVGFTDSLPAGLIVATPNGVTNRCQGTITATPGTNTISLSGVTLAAGSSCNVTVNVSATTLGQKTNTVTVTSDQGSGLPATATLIVNPPSLPPTMTKSFNPAGIRVFGTATITFTITNPNASELTSVGFTDLLPAGLIVATPNGVINLCQGTITGTPGTNIISLSGVTLAPGSQCTMAVNVSATTSGQKTNTVTLTSDQGSGNSVATLTVFGFVSDNGFGSTVPSTIVTVNPQVDLDATGSFSPNGPITNYEYAVAQGGQVPAILQQPGSPKATIQFVRGFGDYFVALTFTDSTNQKATQNIQLTHQG
jgi:uncharacterized repeat protein (TIGR01451 family)